MREAMLADNCERRTEMTDLTKEFQRRYQILTIERDGKRVHAGSIAAQVIDAMASKASTASTRHDADC
jgi:hypothetical protein